MADPSIADVSAILKMTGLDPKLVLNVWSKDLLNILNSEAFKSKTADAKKKEIKRIMRPYAIDAKDESHEVQYEGRKNLSNIRYQFFNIFANNAKKKVCRDCVIRTLNLKDFNSHISNIRHRQTELDIEYGFDEEDCKKKACFDEKGKLKKTHHYIAEIGKFPHKLKQNLRTNNRDLKIKVFYVCEDAVFSQFRNPYNLEVDHRIPRRVLRKNPQLVAAHDCILSKLDAVVPDYNRKKLETFTDFQDMFEKLSKVHEIYNYAEKEEYKFLFKGIYLFFQLLTKADNLAKDRCCSSCQLSVAKYKKKSEENIKRQLEKINEKISRHGLVETKSVESHIDYLENQIGETIKKVENIANQLESEELKRNTLGLEQKLKEYKEELKVRRDKLDLINKLMQDREELEEQLTQIHRAFPSGIDYFYTGGRGFNLERKEDRNNKDPIIEACEGCYWYNPYLWKYFFSRDANDWIKEYKTMVDLNFSKLLEETMGKRDDSKRESKLINEFLQEYKEELKKFSPE